MEGTEITEEPQLCEFYLRGACHFGDKCRNFHGGSVEGADAAVPKDVKKQKVKKNTGSTSNDDKRRKMRTALDVIKRIQWDDALPQELFTIGYLDRFAGIVVSVCLELITYYGSSPQ